MINESAIVLQFSFSPDMWGTVSDWVMVVVTIITGYFLYQGLVSQQKQIRNEDTRRRLQNLPLIAMEDAKIGLLSSDNSITIAKINLKFSVNHNEAYELLILEHYFPWTLRDFAKRNLGVAETFEIEATMRLKPELDRNDLDDQLLAIQRQNFYITFGFTDRFRNRYKQLFLFTISFPDKIEVMPMFMSAAELVWPLDTL